jgi:hypothetical protein
MSRRAKFIVSVVFAILAVTAFYFYVEKNHAEFEASLTAEDKANIEQVKKDLSVSERGWIIEYRSGRVEVIYGNMTEGKTEGICYVELDTRMSGKPVELYLSDVDRNRIKRIVRKSDPEWIELIKRYHSDSN